MGVAGWVVCGLLVCCAVALLVVAVWTVATGDVPGRVRETVLWPKLWAAGAAVLAPALLWLAAENVRHNLVGPQDLWWLGPFLMLTGVVLLFASTRPLVMPRPQPRPPTGD